MEGTVPVLMRVARLRCAMMNAAALLRDTVRARSEKGARCLHSRLAQFSLTRTCVWCWSGAPGGVVVMIQETAADSELMLARRASASRAATCRRKLA
ncbi:hypothetical protein HYPSUDRAFT_893958 [Hypholoma sublateritium FD-334 SS-4]|uniref:Uncharacterized protein n=1 Tax=Hypholoma sublateritium (strain FD-334 SS-4) TaxID=945553 RepID=A0A0D2KY27_HYPSF|nr:hypothetical protein HYPSUDRAFT_893958 [Hypholoma sublateritium FD-334 SS-4]